MAGAPGDSTRGHTVVAAFDDLESARGAIVAIERNKTESGAIKLLRRGEDEAPMGSAARQRDVRMTGAVGRNALKAFPIGAIIGAVIAVAAGYILGSDFNAEDIPGPAIAGALLGGALAALFGVFAKLPANTENWERTFDDDTEGDVFVSVRSSDPAVVASAAEVLVDLRPKSVRRYDPSGRPVTS